MDKTLELVTWSGVFCGGENNGMKEELIRLWWAITNSGGQKKKGESQNPRVNKEKMIYQSRVMILEFVIKKILIFF